MDVSETGLASKPAERGSAGFGLPHIRKKDANFTIGSLAGAAALNRGVAVVAGREFLATRRRIG